METGSLGKEGVDEVGRTEGNRTDPRALGLKMEQRGCSFTASSTQSYPRNRTFAPSSSQMFSNDKEGECPGRTRHPRQLQVKLSTPTHLLGCFPT